MKLTEILKSDNVTISCELFPPKQGAQLDNYKKIVAEMASVKPAYISVTYGATGGTSDYTVELANEVRNVNHIPALAHLTCASSTKEKVAEVIKELKEKNIENILALRGDIPANAEFPLPDQYHHAAELIADIKEHGDFCIGGACYPEGHPEADTIFEDLTHLKEKVDAGCEFLTTQMFFENNILYNFMYKALKYGIDVPIVAGIMPITSKAQVKRSISLSGCMIPPRFAAIVDRFGDKPEAMKQAGIAYATDQIIDLIANGVDHVHIYTMNKPDVAAAILDNLSYIYVRE
jgi:methylenetetrahydrofolate reductase (NADPH)